MIRVKYIIEKMFSVPTEPRSFCAVIFWWEARRIPYNLILGISGIAGLLVYAFFISISGVLEPGEDLIEPMALIAAPFVVNMCYTAGWATELLVRAVYPSTAIGFGPRLFRLGLLLSVVITVLPGIYWGAFCFVKLMRVLGI